MKKLIVLMMLMALVTTVKAQVVTAERDYIMEQVIHSVSMLKANADRANEWKSSFTGFTVQEDLNPFQYIRQQADYISIASTGLYYGADEMLSSRKDAKPGYLLGTSAEVMYGDQEEDCSKSKKSHPKY